jgi:hypothetical protein
MALLRLNMKVHKDSVDDGIVSIDTMVDVEPMSSSWVYIEYEGGRTGGQGHEVDTLLEWVGMKDKRGRGQ